MPELTLMRKKKFYTFYLLFWFASYMFMISLILRFFEQNAEIADISWQLTYLALAVVIFVVNIICIPFMLTDVGYYNKKFLTVYAILLAILLLSGLLLTSVSLTAALSVLLLPIMSASSTGIAFSFVYEPHTTIINWVESPQEVKISVLHKFLWKREYTQTVTILKCSPIYLSRNIYPTFLINFGKKFHNLFIVENGQRIDLNLIPTWYWGIKVYTLLDQLFHSTNIKFESSEVLKEGGHIYQPLKIIAQNDFSAVSPPFANNFEPSLEKKAIGRALIKSLLSHLFLIPIYFILAVILFSLLQATNYLELTVAFSLTNACVIFFGSLEFQYISKNIIAPLVYLFGSPIMNKTSGYLQLNYKFIQFTTEVLILPQTYEVLRNGKQMFMAWRLNEKIIVLPIREIKNTTIQ